MSVRLTADEKAARERRKSTRPGQRARRDFDPKAPRPSALAQERHSSPPAISSALQTDRDGYTAPGTKHTPTVRKGQGGRRIPRGIESRAFPVAPGPGRSDIPSPANLRARKLFADVPQPTRVLTLNADVPAATPGQPRRRDRRPAAVAAAKAARRAAAAEAVA